MIELTGGKKALHVLEVIALNDLFGVGRHLW